MFFSEPIPIKEDDRKQQLPEFVRTINQNIRIFHMEIKKGVSEDEGVSYYCLVSNGGPLSLFFMTALHPVEGGPGTHSLCLCSSGEELFTYL